MPTDDLLQQLRDLEVALHQPRVRSDVQRLDELLHESFIEFGRSGRRYDKADILRELPSEALSETIWSQDFALAELSDGVALLTYRSGQMGEGGSIGRHALRSSLWQRTAQGWQMRFHQGTPTDAFESQPSDGASEETP